MTRQLRHYQIILGWDCNGRIRPRYFATLDDACVFAGWYHQRTGIILGITKVGG